MKNLLSYLKRDDKIYITLQILIYFLIPIICYNSFSYYLGIMIISLIVSLFSGFCLNINKEILPITSVIMAVSMIIYNFNILQISEIVYLILLIALSLITFKQSSTVKIKFFVLSSFIVPLIASILGIPIALMSLLLLIISNVSFLFANFIRIKSFKYRLQDLF